MTLRQFVYRFLYLKSPGWKATKRFRKASKCKRCSQVDWLELHHLEYRWHNRHPILKYFFPNLSDKMVTLCDYHHEKAHKR